MQFEQNNIPLSLTIRVPSITQGKVKITCLFHESCCSLEDISFMLNQVVYKEKQAKILREIHKTE